MNNATKIESTLSDQQISKLIMEKQINKNSSFISERQNEMGKIIDQFTRDQTNLDANKVTLNFIDELDKKKNDMTVRE